LKRRRSGVDGRLRKAKSGLEKGGEARSETGEGRGGPISSRRKTTACRVCRSKRGASHGTIREKAGKIRKKKRKEFGQKKSDLSPSITKKTCPPRAAWRTERL